MNWSIITAWLASLQGALVLSGLVGALGLWQFVRLFIAQRRLVAGLDQALKHVQAYTRTELAAEFETLNELLSNHELLKAPWSAYEETLVRPIPGDPEQIVRSTVPATHHFTDDILRTRINFRWYTVVPNLLTGGGLLGTFIGLTAGIFLAQAGLVASDVDEMQAAVSRLLGGASTAFITSIVGLLSSIGFTGYERATIRSLQSLLAQFATALEQRIPLVTNEQLSVNAIRELRMQTEQLQRFNSELGVTLAQALEERLAQRLSPALDRLIASVEGLRQDRGTASDAMLQHVVSEFKATLSGAAGVELQALSGTLTKLNSDLSQLASNLAHGGRDIHEQLTSAVDAFRVGVDQLLQRFTEQQNEARRWRQEEHESTSRAITESMERVAQYVDRFSAQFSATLGEAAASAQEKLNTSGQVLAWHLEEAGRKVVEMSSTAGSELASAGQAFRDSVRRLAESVDQGERVAKSSVEVLRQLQNTLAELRQISSRFAETDSGLRQAAELLATAGVDIADGLRATSNATLTVARAADGLRVQSEAITATWEAQKGSFKELDDDLQSVFREIAEAVTQYTEGIRQFVQEVDSMFAEATTSLAGLVTQLSDILEDLLDANNRHER